MFGGDGLVRVELDWSALSGANLVVTERFSRSREVLGDLYTVWYTREGAPAVWDEPGSRPLRVRDAPDQRRAWPVERRRRVGYLESRFRGEPVQLVLPLYALPDGGGLILDGTHRAVAAYAAGADVRLLMFSLRGPLRPDWLPDLAHHPNR